MHRCGAALLGAGLAALALPLPGCRPAGEALVSYRLLAMATWVDLSLPPGALEREPGLVSAIERELGEFGRDYYAWGDGELAALNRALSDRGEFEASAPLANLLVTAQTIAAVTDGAFDPGVGPLVELWGFNAGDPPHLKPADGAVAATLAASRSIADLVIDGHRVELPPPAGGPRGPDVATKVTYDLGGIAKGAAVDRIVARLEAAGAEPALVNAGGDLRVVGRRSDRRWRIGIAAPRGDDAILGTIELEPGEAAFTSGDYERYFEQDGVRLHHILDPRTGYPVLHTQSLTVIAGNGTLADAAATALFVAGPDRWRQAAAALGISAVLRVDATGAIEMTPEMRDRFQTSAASTSDIITAAN